MILGNVALNADVEIVENTGGEKIVYFNINNAKCTAKVPLDFSFNNKINLKISIEDLYFFDKENGQNLLCKK